MKAKVSLFVDRKRELAELESSKHAVLVGYRRMGKTHLIVKYLLSQRNKKTVSIYLDMLYFSSWEEFADHLVEAFLSAYDEISSQDFSTFLNRISFSVSSMVSSVKEIEGKLGIGGVNFFSMKLAFREHKKNEFDVLKAALDFISEFAEKKNIFIIISLDEIQNIKTYGGVEKGLSILRGQLQFMKNTQLIMSGSLPSFMYSHIMKKSKPFWKQLKTMEIKSFDLPAVIEALHVFGIKEQYGPDIFKITRGIPDYVIKILEKMKKKGTVLAAFEQTIADESMFFSSLISSLSKAEHFTLASTASNVSYAEIEARLGYPPTALFASLIKKGFLEKHGKGIYEIVDPGLAYFLKS